MIKINLKQFVIFKLEFRVKYRQKPHQLISLHICQDCVNSYLVKPVKTGLTEYDHSQ